MKRLFPLFVACAAFLFTSCGGGNSNQEAQSDDATADAPAATEEASQAPAEDGPNTIHLTGNDQMKYNKTEFTVKAGEEITLTLENIGNLPPEAMSHNVVVLKVGSSTDDYGNAAVSAKDEDYIPSSKNDEVIAHTKMLAAGEKDTIKFTLDEPGDYPFVCSFPGHHGSMHGIITAE